MKITNHDKLGRLLKENRPLPTAVYDVTVSNALSRITNAGEYSQQSSQFTKKKLIWKYTVSAAALAVIGIGITLGYFFWQKPQNSIIVENTPAITMPVPTSSAGKALTVQDRVIEAHEYGIVSLSTRSSAEVGMLMQLAGIPDEDVDQVICYEDERYLYFFNDDGTTSGIMATYMSDNTFDPDTVWSRVHLSEDEAIALAKDALLKYCDSYTDETAERFKIETRNADAGDIPHFPEWSITFSEYTQSGICRNTILVEIDMYGNVATIFFGARSNVSDEQLDQNVYISEETAVSLALAQFKKEDRNVDLEHFTVTATLIEHNGMVEWMLFFEEIADENGEYMNGGWRQCYWMVLDAVSGEWISTDVSR